MVLLLLFNGADPNAHCYHLTRPLHIAAAVENIELVELLLKHGANVDIRDFNGNTALHHVLYLYELRNIQEHDANCEVHVASSNAKSALDILLEKEADVNIANLSGETPLYRAASRELPDVVRKMLEKYGGNPNTGNSLPLVASCLAGNEELVEMLLKHGADPNMASTSYDPFSQKLPLFVALKGNYTHIISLLLNAGATVNMVNHEGRNTVCFVAELLTNNIYHSNSTEEMTKNISIIRLLLQHGANFNMLMPDGHSPLYPVVSAINAPRRRDRAIVIELL